MTINAMIPLATEVPNLARSVTGGAVAGNQLMNLIEDRKLAPMRQQAAQMELETGKINLESGRLGLSRDKALEQLRRAAFDIGGVKTALASGDPKRAVDQLRQRRADIIARDGASADTTHTDGWIAAIESGDPAQIDAFAQEAVEIEQAYRTYHPDAKSAEKPAGWANTKEDAQGNLWGTNPQTGQFERIPTAQGVSFAKPTEASYSQPVAGVDPVTGQPMFARFDPKSNRMIPVAGFAPPPKSGGMSMTTNPDGTVTWAMGGEGGSVSSSTNNKIEESILANQQNMQLLNNINTSFRPEYLTLAGRYGATVANMKDKLGQLDPNSSEAKTLRGYTQFTADAGEQFAKTLKEMSGGAVTPQESKRQETYLGDIEGDGPVAFQTKVDRQMQFVRSANARLHYAKSQGLSQAQMWGIPLDSVPAMINARGEELEGSGMPPEQVRAQLQQEFGL